MTGKNVKVIVDRPLGSRHPQHRDIVYPINYGYIENVFAGDGEEQDAYIIGIDHAVDEFVGEVVAVIRRHNDNEDKWVVAPSGSFFSEEYIRSATNFQEQYFDTEIVLVGSFEV